MAISSEDVRHVGRLARLHLSESELEAFTAQLNDILAHVARLAELDTTGSGGSLSVAEWPAPLRADTPGADALELPATQLSPHSRAGLFTVPRLAALDSELT